MIGKRQLPDGHLYVPSPGLYGCSLSPPGPAGFNGSSSQLARNAEHAPATNAPITILTIACVFMWWTLPGMVSNSDHPSGAAF